MQAEANVASVREKRRIFQQRFDRRSEGRLDWGEAFDRTDFCSILFVVVEVQVVCDRHAMAGGDGRDLVLDIAEERGICEKRVLRRVLGDRLGGVEVPFGTAVTQQKCTSFVRSGEDHDEGAEHRWPAGRVLVRLEKGRFSCMRTWYKNSSSLNYVSRVQDVP